MPAPATPGTPSWRGGRRGTPIRDRPGYIKLTQPADLRNLTELGADVHLVQLIHIDYEGCHRRSDDSYDNGGLGWRGTALVGPESLQEGSCSPHIQSPAYRCQNRRWLRLNELAPSELTREVTDLAGLGSGIVRLVGSAMKLFGFSR